MEGDSLEWNLLSNVHHAFIMRITDYKSVNLSAKLPIETNPKKAIESFFYKQEDGIRKE